MIMQVCSCYMGHLADMPSSLNARISCTFFSSHPIFPTSLMSISGTKGLISKRGVPSTIWGFHPNSPGYFLARPTRYPNKGGTSTPDSVGGGCRTLRGNGFRHGYRKPAPALPAAGGSSLSTVDVRFGGRLAGAPTDADHSRNVKGIHIRKSLPEA